MDVQEALVLERKKRARIAADYKALAAALESADLRIAVLESLDKEYGGVQASSILTANRTDAILQVLEDTSSPMSPEDIRQILNDRGRNDEYNAVSAALAHLQRTSRVHSVGRGAWLPGPDPDEGPPIDEGAWEALQQEHDEELYPRERGEIL